MTAPPLVGLVGTVVGGKFRIDRALASGASGDVYEAMHLGLPEREVQALLAERFRHFKSKNVKPSS